MSDFKTLEQIATRKDTIAFRELFEKYGPLVKAFMMRQGANPATAEELAQETLMVVWKKAALYSREKGNVATWIFAIARNLRIDRLRKEETWVELPDFYEEEASADALPDEVLSNNQLQSTMKQALERLPADQRDVVVLSFVEGLPHREIADRLKIPVGTVKSRIRLAYGKLREVVGDLER